MTEEEKQLLLQDLCARLQYGVNVLLDLEKQFDGGSICTLTSIDTKTSNAIFHVDVTLKDLQIEEIRPYLRPISSMTEKEKKELWTAIYKDMSIIESNFDAPIINEYEGKVYRGNPIHYELDFLISHHFDYLDLIPKGLALEASEGMYND